MFKTTRLDVAIGLVFMFLGISLIVSAITEGVASMVNWRARTLLAGVQSLLNDPNFTALAKDLYYHALINPLAAAPSPAQAPGTGAAGNATQLTANVAAGRKPDVIPAYIDPNRFAAALTEVTDLAHVSPDAMLETIKAAPLDDQIKVFLCGVCRRANGDLSEMRDEIASWFDGAMDRVSGKYKRHAQLFSFVTALVVSVGLNVSTIRVAQALWDQPALAKSVAANPSLDANAALGQLESMNLPIGWVPEHTTTDRVLSAGLFVGWSGHSRAWWATSILGWLLTAGATLFGAPFWFDTLQQFVRLKGAGPSPADKLNK